MFSLPKNCPIEVSKVVVLHKSEWSVHQRISPTKEVVKLIKNYTCFNITYTSD